MDLDAVLKLLGAVGGPTSIVALYRWAVAQGKKQALAEQAEKTLAAKDAEIAALHAEVEQLEGWVDALTRPPGRSR